MVKVSPPAKLRIQQATAAAADSEYQRAQGNDGDEGGDQGDHEFFAAVEIAVHCRLVHGSLLVNPAAG